MMLLTNETQTKKIIIARDFTLSPGPRYRRIGKGSGEEFCDEYLIPAMEQHARLIVNLDGVKGFGSSFLEEAFAGAVRKGVKISRDNLVLESSNESLLKKVWGYIDEAMAEKYPNGL